MKAILELCLLSGSVKEAIESLFSGKISPGDHSKSNNKGVKGENSSCCIESLSHPQLSKALIQYFLKENIKHWGIIEIWFFFLFLPLPKYS